MFTGLIEEVGTVTAVTPSSAADGRGDAVRITVHAPLVTEDAKLGDSIAVDGVCLTVISNEDGSFSADVMQETLRRSRLGSYRSGDQVNLERALLAGARLGGHIVQGHVDGVGELLSRVSTEHWDILRFALPPSLSPYVVEKGSIAVNGTSLTVSSVQDGWFEVSLIPTTLAATTAGTLEVGSESNFEVDILAKYVEKMVRR